jgi:hypothetical protein
MRQTSMSQFRTEVSGTDELCLRNVVQVSELCGNGDELMRKLLSRPMEERRGNDVSLQ